MMSVVFSSSKTTRRRRSSPNIDDKDASLSSTEIKMQIYQCYPSISTLFSSFFHISKLQCSDDHPSHETHDSTLPNVPSRSKEESLMIHERKRLLQAEIDRNLAKNDRFCITCWYTDLVNRMTTTAAPRAHPPSLPPPSATMTTTTSSVPDTPFSLAREKARVQAELDRLDQEGSCPSCLYTGVATCVGLALYFTHLAFDEDAPREAVNAVKTGKSKSLSSLSAGSFMVRKAPPRFSFLAIAAGWVGAGVYRWYLG